VRSTELRTYSRTTAYRTVPGSPQAPGFINLESQSKIVYSRVYFACRIITHDSVLYIHYGSKRKGDHQP